MNDITCYVCNKSFSSYEIDGIVLPRGKATGISDEQRKTIETNHYGKILLNKGAIYIEKEVPAAFKTTGQQLVEANNNAKKLQEELDATKKEALDELAKRDLEIEALKKQLAEAKGA